VNSWDERELRRFVRRARRGDRGGSRRCRHRAPSQRGSRSFQRTISVVSSRV
jgi:hypothetical protein